MKEIDKVLKVLYLLLTILQLSFASHEGLSCIVSPISLSLSAPKTRKGYITPSALNGRGL